MKIFSALYQWTLRWAEHKLAPKMLALLTFAESVFFPILHVGGGILESNIVKRVCHCEC